MDLKKVKNIIFHKTLKYLKFTHELLLQAIDVRLGLHPSAVPDFGSLHVPVFGNLRIAVFGNLRIAVFGNLRIGVCGSLHIDRRTQDLCNLHIQKLGNHRNLQVDFLTYLSKKTR